MDEREKAQKAPETPWSFRIASVAGIPVRIHFTFFLLLVWVALANQAQGAAMWVLLIISLFACVVFHELGHALVAKRYGIKTRDITLYPIGGIAMIEQRPKPAQELWISLAGPAVNVVIAGLLVPVVLALQGHAAFWQPDLERGTFAQRLLVANVALVLFNLVPAFPMDGGRVLRALLGLKMSDERATRIAAGFGQFFAIVFGLVGLFAGSVLLMLVAFFVFVGAAQEVNATVSRSIVEGRRVSEAMMTHVATIESGLTLDVAANMLIEGAQQDFPIVVGDEVLGLLERSDVARGLAQDGPGAYVAGYMRREFRSLAPYAPLEKALELFSGGDRSPILVMSDGRLLGMVTIENLSEFLMLQHARARKR